jgi:hypothetical protein
MVVNVVAWRGLKKTTALQTFIIGICRACAGVLLGAPAHLGPRPKAFVACATAAQRIWR